MIPPADTAWYTQTKVPCTPYDPEDAKTARRGIGIPEPDHGAPSDRRAAGSLVQAQFIQAQEAAVGFNVVIDVLTAAAYERRVASGNFDAHAAASAEQPGPDSYIYRFSTSGRRSNHSGYSNPRLDYVLANALKAAEPKARAVDYRVAQQIIHAPADDPPPRPRRTPIFDSDLKRDPVRPVRDPALRERAVQELIVNRARSPSSPLRLRLSCSE